MTLAATGPIEYKTASLQHRGSPVSNPFIIWTMQRTGGTSLTELLMAMSEHKSVDHEPFNWRRDPRCFAPVSRAWAETQNRRELRASLAKIFAEGCLIKHCYEFHLPSFNRNLVQAAAEFPEYRHIHLLRRDELGRLTSKFIAQANGTWFREYGSKVYNEIRAGRRRLAPLPVEQVVEQYNHAREAADQMRRMLKNNGVVFRPLFYEELFVGGREKRLGRLALLLQFLGFEGDAIDRHRPLIDEKIFKSGQNTASVLRFVPNLDKVVEAVAAAGYRGPVPKAVQPAAQ
jgi:LPS sulfotransferase NodH